SQQGPFQDCDLFPLWRLESLPRLTPDQSRWHLFCPMRFPEEPKIMTLSRWGFHAFVRALAFLFVLMNEPGSFGRIMP
ncbi:MAG: hypothetical protein ACYCYP_03395, partial [Leptospirales bacterium]